MIGVGALAAVGKAILHLDRAGAAILLAVSLILAVARLAAIPIWSAIARGVGISTALAIGYGLCASGYLAGLWLSSMSNRPDLSVSTLVSLTVCVVPIAMLCGIGETCVDRLPLAGPARSPLRRTHEQDRGGIAKRVT